MDSKLPINPCCSEIVEIRVGKDHTSFKVHKDVLCEQSSFFRGCFNGGFMESKSKIVDLPEDPPTAFGILVYYVYRQNILITDEIEDVHDGQIVIVETYILADKYCMEDFKNDLVDFLYDALSCGYEVSTAAMKLFEDKAMEGSLLEKMLLDGLARQIFGDVDTIMKEGPIAKFVKGGGRQVQLLTHRLAMKVDKGVSLDKCKYHEHKETPVCATDP